MAGFNACGDLYLQRIGTDAAYWGGAALNLTEVSISNNSEITTRTGRGTNSCGETLDSFATGTGSTITISTDEVADRNTMALLLRGTDTTVTQSETPVTDESVTASIVNGQGYWIKLAYHPIKAASVTVDTDPATTPYVEGTDYEIDYNLGMFRPIAGGGITDGDPLLIDYTYTAITGGWEITGGKLPSVKVKIIGIFKNKVDGSLFKFEAPQVTFSGEATLAFIGDDFATGSITGQLEIASGLDYPWKITKIG